jgi:prolyl-tRNA synthetase
MKCDIRQTAKAIVLKGTDDIPVLLVLRGDHSLNEIKASKLPQLKFPLEFAATEDIVKYFGAHPGSLGPVGFKGVIIADRSAAVMGDMIVGANEDGQHLSHVNWGRDCPEPIVADIRNVQDGDPSPDGQGILQICRGIEVGHIFQLRTKYSEALKCQYLDATAQKQAMEMGCYGIGISRIVGAAIEQNFDERGVCLPKALSPFECIIIPIGYEKSESVRKATDMLYAECLALGIDVLLDDRNERLGVLLADSELIGIPHRIVIGERGLAEGTVEYQTRRDTKPESVELSKVLSHLLSCDIL